MTNKKNDMVKTLDILKKNYKDPVMLSSFTDGTPFQILISTVLSARSRDEEIIKIIKDLFFYFPEPYSMSEAPIPKIERLIKSSGFYRTKAKNIKQISKIIVDEYGGKVPEDFNDLVNLPGVGRKTAACVMVYAYGKPAIPVDTHVQRVANRLGWVSTKDPEDTEMRLMKLLPKRYWKVINELLIIHGRKVCNPVTPKCSVCRLKDYCPKIGVKKSK